MTKLLRSVLFACAALTLYAADARAEAFSIGTFSNCVTCQGASYTLDIIGLAPVDLNTADGSFDTYRVALTIDTSTYTGTGIRIDEVAVKISDTVDTATLVSAPGGLGVWQPILPGGLGNGGCTGSGSGFECADWKAGSASGAFVGGVYTWVFDIDISSALYSFTTSDPNLLPVIKARYVDQYGQKVGTLVSEKVPEPTTLALLGLGATLAAIRRRRSLR